MSDPSDNRSFLQKFRMPIAAFVALAAVLGYLAVDEGWFAPTYAPPPPQAAAPPVPPVSQAPALPPLPVFVQAAAPPIGAIVAPPAPPAVENAAPAQPAQPPAVAASNMSASSDDAGVPPSAPAADTVKASPIIDRTRPSSAAADDDIRRRQAQNAQLTLEAVRLGQEAAIEETRLRIARARNEIERLKAPPPAAATALPIVPGIPAGPAAPAREAQDAPPRFYLLALRAGPDGVRRATVAADGGRYDVAQGGVLPGGWTVEAIGSGSITIVRAGARGAAGRRSTIDLAAPSAIDGSTPSPPAAIGPLPVLPIAPGFVGGRP